MAAGSSPASAPTLSLIYAGSDSPPATVLSLDGTFGATHVFAGTPADSFPAQGATIACWIKTGQVAANAAILSFGPTAGGNAGRLWFTNPGALTAHYGTAAGGTAATGLAVNDGAWRHLALGVIPADASHYAVEVWIDGLLRWRSQAALAFAAGGALARSGTFSLGLGQSGEAGLVGAVSELQIWDAALVPPGTAAALMRHRAAAGMPGLALLWPLDVAPSGNSIPPADFVPSSLRFREPDSGQTSFARAQWPAVAGASSYELQAVALDGSWTFARNSITGSGTVQVPIPGLMPGRSYQARVRAVAASVPGPWSQTQQLVPLDLPSLALGFAWPSNGSLSAQWPAVDQAQGYATLVTAAAAASGYQPGTSLDLSSQVTGTDAVTVAARGSTAAAAGGTGAYGPANAPGATTTTPLGFYYEDPDGGGNGNFAFDWTPAQPAPAYFYMEVSKNGTLVASGHVAGGTEPPALLAAPAPVQTGEQFTGRMRRIGDGVLAAWSTQTVTIHGQAAPAPAYQATTPPTAEALALVWGSVAAGATYRLETRTDGGAPVVQSDVTSPYSLMSLLSPDTNPANNHSYTFKLRAVIDGDVGPANPVVTPPVLTGSFRYVWNGGQDAGTLAAGWTPATGTAQAYVRVFSGSSATPAAYGLAAVTQGSFAVAPPPGGFVVGTAYTAQLRALATGAMTAAQFAQVTIHQLGTAVVQLAQSQPAAIAVEARWTAINPELTPSYLPVLNGAEGALQTTRTIDLTSHLNDAAALTVQVRVEADQSYGPLSATSPAPGLQPAFRYLLTGGGTQSLTASWTPAPLVYLSVQKTGGGAADPQLFSGGTTASYAVPVPGGGFAENDVYGLSIKSAADGTLGAMTTVQVTVHQLAQPAPAFQAPASADPVTLQWADIRTQAQKDASLAVTYEVLVNGVAVSNQPSGLSYALSAAQLAAAGAQSITVQPHAQGSWGVVSVPPTLAAPAATALTYDAAAAQMALGWNQAAGASGYYVELRRDSDGALLARQWVAQPGGQTPATAVFNASGLTMDASYTARTRAMAGGAMTAFAALSLTVKQLVGPSSITLTPTFSQRQIAAAWQFDTSGLGTVTYVAELRQTDGTVLDRQTPATQSTTLTYPSTVAPGATLNVFVRAVAGGNLGLWSPAQPITIGSDLAQPVITAAAFDTSNNLTVTWNPVAGNGVKYQVQLAPAAGGGTTYTKSNITDTSVQLLKSDTNVADNTLYNVQVRATDPAPAGPWSSVYPVRSDTLVPPDHGGGGGSGSSSDPVLVANGSYAYANVDLEVAGVVALRLDVRYNTVIPLPTDDPPAPGTPLGRRWTHVYTTRIARSPDGKTAAVYWGDGTVALYTVPGSVTGTYAKQGQPNGDLLVCLPSLALELTRRDQSVYRFDSAGTLQQIVSPQGNPVNLTYADGRLDRVTDQGSGRYLRFSYFTSGTDAGRIRTVADNAGRSISYAYTGGDLTTYTDTTQQTRQFTYWPNSLMHTATDQVHDTFITNTYDAKNRVVRQKDARATASGQDYYTRFDYVDQTIDGVDYVQTTVTDRLDQVTVYLSVKVTLNTVSEIHNLAGGSVWRVLRSFDGVGNLLSETVYQGPPGGAAAVGATTSYTYDGARNRTSVTDPLGQTAIYTYDDGNRLTGATDPYGNLTTIAYAPGLNLPRSIAEPTGRKQVFAYRSVGGIVGLVDTYTDYPVGDGPGSVGNVTGYQYYPTGEVELVTDPLRTSIHYVYDTPSGRLKSLEIRDSTGAVALSVGRAYWPGLDRVHTTTVKFPGQPDAQAYVTTTVFDGVGMLTSETDPLQRTTAFHYDANGELDRITYPAAANPDITRLIRDRNDQIVQEVLSAADPTVATGYGYDEIGRLTSITDADLNVTHIAWTMLLQPAGTPSPMKATVTLPTVTVKTPGQAPVDVTYRQTITYDPLGRVIARTDPAPVGGADGPATTIAYSGVAGPGGTTNLRVVTTYPKADPGQPTAYQTTMVYDPAGRPISSTDERGKIWTTVYGGAVDAATATTLRTATTTDPVGVETIETTDAAGRVVALKTGKGASWRTTAVAYDVLDRPVGVDEPNPAPNPPSPTVHTGIGYAYDPATKCIRVTVTPYQTAAQTQLIDGAGQWVGSTDAHGIATSLTYTPRGQLLTYVNGRQQILTYGYDPAGRHVTTAPAEPAALVEQVLDGVGNRLQTKVGGTVRITRAFDTLNRMVSRTNETTAETVAYSYAPTGEIATLLYPGLTSALTYGYDPTRRLRTVTDWAGRQTGYTFAPNGVLAAATLPNGVGLTFSQDDSGRFTGYQAAVGTDLLAQATYTLDAFGEPSQIAELTPLGASMPAGQTLFAYGDPAPDRLTAVDGATIGYDADGNMINVPGVAATLAHNVYNQLVQADSVSYAFDADGLIESRTEGASIRRWVQDPAGYANPMIARPESGDGPTRSLYAALLGGGAAALPEPQALLWPWSEEAAINRPLATVDSGGATTRYVHGAGLIGRETSDGAFQTYVFDGVGSTLALVGASGMTDAFAYDPYGRPAGRQGASDNPFGLHGRWGVITDPSGLCLMRARTYAPTLARFLEKDPLYGNPLFPQTLNSYAFVPGNPLQFLDPLGLGNKDKGGGGGSFWSSAGGVFAIIGILVGGGLALVGIGAAAVGIAGLAAPEALATGLIAAESLPAGASIGGRAAFYVGRGALRVLSPLRSARLFSWAAKRAGTGVDIELQSLLHVA